MNKPPAKPVVLILSGKDKEMHIQPKELPYAYKIKTIDSHTMGEPTRIVYEGFPKLEGKTMMEKKNYLMEHYDFLRKAVMLEPRGHRDMFGALLTEPVHEEADVGVIFLDSGGCLNMCGHGSIGTASMLVETGMVEVKEPYTEVVLDAPSGIIRTKVHVVNKKAKEVSILNVPAFLYKENQVVEIPGRGPICYDISFGGSFFALVNAEKIGLSLDIENIETITELGMEIRRKINDTVEVHHPYLDISTVDLVEFYSHTENENADMKNCVIFGDAQADRSPCGTGTSAKLAALYARGELGMHEEFVYESITGSLFKGEVVKEVEIDGGTGIIPQITGSAYITGINEWILDEDDPLEYGFLLGSQKKEEPESNRSKIVRAAWKLFGKQGYEETTVEDIITQAKISKEQFYEIFKEKDDLTGTLGDFFDQKYAELMVSMNPRLTHYEKLLYLNRELFSLIEKEVPFNLIRHIYVSMDVNQQNLMNRNRFYYHLIPQIIREGQQMGEFKSDEPPESLAESYALLERGLIYNWCLANGEGSLPEQSMQLLSVYLKDLLQ
ncbi:MAG: proline racemase family protein [Agathobacter sp.]